MEIPRPAEAGLGMTWQLVGYEGSEVAIRIAICHYSQQFTCESPLLTPCAPQGHCHPERQRRISFSHISTFKNRPLKREGSPSPIPVLSKIDLQKTFIMFYIFNYLVNVVIGRAEARNHHLVFQSPFFKVN